MSSSVNEPRGRPNVPKLSEIQVPSPYRSSSSILGSHVSPQRFYRKAVAVTAAISQRIANSTRSASSNGLPNVLPDIYQPLLDREFRIIKLHLCNSGPITATMIREHLDTAPNYIALSYAWGDTSETRPIRLDGSDVEVSVNLHGALKAISEHYLAMRFTWGMLEVLVWADALCIDQSNLEERNQQVSIMTSIYQKAQSLAIWLGPKQKEDALASSFLNGLRDSDRLLDYLQITPRGTLLAVASLFSRPYWSRLWILQEIYNSKGDITAYYGDLRNEWYEFQLASEIFQSEEGKQRLDKLLPPNSGHQPLSHMTPNYLSYSQILTYQGPGSFRGILGPDGRSPGVDRLLDVMRLSREKKVTEVRDRVFAIRGVLPQDIRERIKVDYRASLRNIYTDVFHLVVETTGLLDIMCESIHFPLYRGVVDLPSWLPDWSHTPMVSSLVAKYPRTFCAHAGTSAEWNFESHLRDKIFITAVIVGEIHTVGTSLNTGCRANDYIRAFEGWRLELMNHFKPASADTTEEVAWEGKKEELAAWIAKEEEFCRTISLGNSGKKDCYPMFASMIHSRFPYQPLDGELKRHAEQRGVLDNADRQLLQDNFAENMMGRCFCVTSMGDLGLGSGLMRHGDLVVVAPGCRTPIILRRQGVTEDRRPVYRFVGDIYLHGYMNGEALGIIGARARFLIQ